MAKIYDTEKIKDRLNNLYNYKYNDNDEKRCHLIDFEQHLNRPAAYHIGIALNNLIATYGEEELRSYAKKRLKLINSKRKAA